MWVLVLLVSSLVSSSDGLKFQCRSVEHYGSLQWSFDELPLVTHQTALTRGESYPPGRRIISTKLHLITRLINNCLSTRCLATFKGDRTECIHGRLGILLRMFEKRESFSTRNSRILSHRNSCNGQHSSHSSEIPVLTRPNAFQATCRANRKHPFNWPKFSVGHLWPGSLYNLYPGGQFGWSGSSVGCCWWPPWWLQSAAHRSFGGMKLVNKSAPIGG